MTLGTDLSTSRMFDPFASSGGEPPPDAFGDCSATASYGCSTYLTCSLRQTTFHTIRTVASQHRGHIRHFIQAIYWASCVSFGSICLLLTQMLSLYGASTFRMAAVRTLFHRKSLKHVRNMTIKYRGAWAKYPYPTLLLLAYIALQATLSAKKICSGTPMAIFLYK
jgi:hypothetical protein